jgi:hypothetical protein
MTMRHGDLPHLIRENYADLHSHLEPVLPSRKVQRVGACWHGNGPPYLRFIAFIKQY